MRGTEELRGSYPERQVIFNLLLYCIATTTLAGHAETQTGVVD